MQLRGGKPAVAHTASAAAPAAVAAGTTGATATVSTAAAADAGAPSGRRRLSRPSVSDVWFRRRRAFAMRARERRG